MGDSLKDSSAFDVTSSVLESLTSMSRIETRGTLRIALRTAGFQATRVSRREMAAVAKTTLPPELTARGVTNAKEICQRLVQRLDDDFEDERPDVQPDGAC